MCLRQHIILCGFTSIDSINIFGFAPIQGWFLLAKIKQTKITAYLRCSNFPNVSLKHSSTAISSDLPTEPIIVPFWVFMQACHHNKRITHQWQSVLDSTELSVWLKLGRFQGVRLQRHLRHTHTLMSLGCSPSAIRTIHRNLLMSSPE